MKLLNSKALIKTLSAGAACVATFSLSAELLVYEPFDYALDESVEFQNGGLGWSGAWGFRLQFDGKGTQVTDSAIVESGLTYGSLNTAGNSIHMYGDFGSLELGREFDAVITGTAGTRTYISFIGQRVGPEANPDDTELYPDGYPYGENLYPRGAAVRFFNDTNGEVFQIGNFSNAELNEWSIFAGGQRASGVAFTELAFVVVRIDHVGDALTADNIYMWVNPDLSQGEDIGSANVAIVGITDINDPEQAIDFSNLAWISPWVGNDSSNRPHAEMLLDEFRIGTTWDDVTPGGGSGAPEWANLPIDGNGFVNSMDWMGYLYVENAPWIFSTDLHKYLYIPEDHVTVEGGWVFVPAP